MKRRSFLQAAVAAIVGLPSLLAGRKPCTEKRYWFDIKEPDKREFNRSYSWREVTMDTNSDGHLVRVYWGPNPGGRFGAATEVWRRS